MDPTKSPNDCCQMETGVKDDIVIANYHQTESSAFIMTTAVTPFSQYSMETCYDNDDDNVFSQYDSSNNILLLQPVNLESISHIDISKYSLNNFSGQFHNLMDNNQDDQRQQQHAFYQFQTKTTTFYDSQLKCPICLKHNKKLFCSNCIKNGDFTHSKNNFLERFADKKLKFIKLKEEQYNASMMVKKHFDNDKIKDVLICKIVEKERDIKTLKQIYAEKSSMINETKTLLDKTERERLKCHKKQLTLQERIHHVKNQLAKQNVQIYDCFQEKTNQEIQMKILMQNKLILLTKFIYPVSENILTPSFHEDIGDINENSGDSCEAMPLLVHHEFSDKLSSVNQNQQQKMIVKYTIVDSWIGLNEDYQEKVQSHSNSVEYLNIKDNSFRDDHRRIMSALSYLCHLTNLIAFICKIHLPRKILFSELTCKSMRKEEFNGKIAELNINILFLCLINHVDIRLLNPRQPLKNMKHFFDSVDIAKNLDYHLEIPNTFYKMIQDELLNDLNQAEDDVRFNAIDMHDDHEFDFVESNIPDLNLEIDQPSSFLSSLVSSFYKRTTNG